MHFHKDRIISTLLKMHVLFSVLVIFWLIIIPTDPKNAVFIGLSWSRLTLIGSVVVFGIISGYFGFKGIPNRVNPGNWDHEYKAVLIIFYVVNILGVLGWVLIIFGFPGALVKDGAIYNRLLPVLFLASIIITIWSVSFYALDLFRVHSACSRWFSKNKRSILLGIFLILISIFVSYFTVFFSYYNLGDEGDTITTGWLMSKGWVLYRDIFSHHFPLSYSLVSLIFTFVPNSIFSIRIGWIIIRALIFLATMVVSRKYLSTGFMALTWSIVGNFYLGNMLLYQSINAVMFSCVLTLTLSILEAKENNPWWRFAFLGILIGFACLNDPIAVFGAGIVFLALLVGQTNFKSRISISRQGLQNLLIFILPSAAIGIIFLSSLVITRSAQDFVSNAILFNSDIYRKYTIMLSSQKFVYQLRTGLDIINPIWLQETNLYYSWPDFFYFDRWLFTGFFFRLIILIPIFFLLLNKKIIEAILITLLSTLFAARSGILFQGSGFISISLTIGILFWFGDLPSDPGINQQKKITAFIFSLLKLSGFIVICLLLGRLITFYVDHKVDLIFENVYKNDIELTSYIRKATCDYPKVKLLFYPLNPIVYLMTNIEPASKHIFMLPWNAEIGQGQVVKDLTMSDALVYIDMDANVWGRPTAKYMSDIIRFVKNDYVQVDRNLFASKRLQAYCNNSKESK